MGTAATLPYVKFLPNIPVDLAFKFADGKPIAGRYGPSVMFTTIKDEVAFFHPTEAAEIEALRLAPGEPIRITKTRDEKNRQYLKFEKLGAQRDGTFVVSKVSGASPSQVTAPLSSISQVHSTLQSGSQHSTDGAGGGTGNGAGGRPMPDSPYEHSGVSLFLREQTNMLIDVFASCVAYAQRYNGACKPDDVRTLLITTYIQHSKGPRPVTWERAVEINDLLVSHSLARMGIVEMPQALPADWELAELLEAGAIVQGRNRTETNTVRVFCDPRFVAALYTAYHYDAAGPEDIEPICETADGRMLVVIDKRCAKREAE